MVVLMQYPMAWKTFSCSVLHNNSYNKNDKTEATFADTMKSTMDTSNVNSLCRKLFSDNFFFHSDREGIT